jgi:hypothetical protein
VTLKAQQYINHPIRALFTGKSGSGKTTLAVNLVNDVLRYQIDRFIFVCPTFFTQSIFRILDDLVNPSRDVWTDPEKDTFMEIKNQLLKQEEYCRINNLHPIKTLVFIDDLSGLPIMHGGRISAFANFAIQTRHLKCSCFVITQQAKAISCSFRDNVNAVIAFPAQRKEEIRWLQDEYSSADLSTSFMRSMIIQAWKGYGNSHCEEWGKHFLFILLLDREPARYFADFDYSLHSTSKKNL